PLDARTGSRVVVRVRARLAGAVDQPAQLGSVGRALVRAPRIGGGGVVADRGAVVLALPLAVEGTQPLGDLLQVTVAIVEAAGDALAQRIDQRAPEAAGQVVAGRRDVGSHAGRPVGRGGVEVGTGGDGGRGRGAVPRPAARSA